MAKTKTYPYAVWYEDGAYMIYDLTKKDYEDLKFALFSNMGYIELSIGVLSTKGIRSVILQREQQKQQEQQLPDADPPLSFEEWQFLKEQRRKEDEEE